MSKENLLKISQYNTERRPSLATDVDYSSTDLSSRLDSANTTNGTPTVTLHKRQSSTELLSESPEQKRFLKTIDTLNRTTNSRLRQRLNREGDKHKKEHKEHEKHKDDHSKYKSRFGDIHFYSNMTTIFDADYFKESQFFGVYILFWLGTAFLILNNLVHTFLENGDNLLDGPVVRTFKKDLLKIALTDLGMYLTMYVSVFIQLGIRKGWYSWSSTGATLQNIYSFVYFFAWSYFASPKYMDYPWIGKVFLALHSLVFLMKMHSYATYNGYLWNIFNELQVSRKYLKILDETDESMIEGKSVSDLRKALVDSIGFCSYELEYQSKSTSVNTDVEITGDKNKLNTTKSTSSLDDDYVSFPNNITFFDFFRYSMFPTVVYSLKFPRTKRIRWGYVMEKSFAVFGIIFLMITVAQNWMYPIVVRAQEASKLPMSREKVLQYCLVLLDMIPPFLMEYLFTFFLIWDVILNAIAELSRFADRDFYGPWWSCTDWSEFARIWNRPVHKFLLRHVYQSTISTFKLNKNQASLVTFIILSFVHEFVMFVIFRKVRFYMLALQMSQLPLIMISRTNFMRDKKVLGNVICWVGFISGPSMICTLYLVF